MISGEQEIEMLATHPLPQLGLLWDLTVSWSHGDVLAANICDFQVYEKVDSKHKDKKNHLNWMREASCLEISLEAVAKSRGFEDR